MSVKRYDLVGDMDGNCNLNEARMDHSEDGIFVKHEDYAALQQQLEKMAAENAGLKAAAKKVIKMNRQHAKDQHGDPMIAESWACVKVLRKAKSETPATDAFLAEVRASGVDGAINCIKTMMANTAPAHYAVGMLNAYAAQLRKGAQS